MGEAVGVVAEVHLTAPLPGIRSPAVFGGSCSMPMMTRRWCSGSHCRRRSGGRRATPSVTSSTFDVAAVELQGAGAIFR